MMAQQPLSQYHNRSYHSQGTRVSQAYSVARGRSSADQGRNLGGMGPAKEPAIQPLSDQAGSPPDHCRTNIRSYSEERPWARVPARTEGMERMLARPTNWAN